MIEIKIDGDEYSVKQYIKEMTKLFDFYRRDDSQAFGEQNCLDVDCDKCPIKYFCVMLEQQITAAEIGDEDTYDNILKSMEIVHRWNKEKENESKR